MRKEKIKKIVREGYARIAKQGSYCSPANSCCGSTDSAHNISRKIGYTEEDIRMAPEGSNLALGCGNPVALASLKKGETVLDLGSGAGFDCFLVANKIGKSGKVIGVDMTPEMIKKANENARKGKYENVEFRFGEIENLPIADNSIDLVMSNCVINLSPDKRRVFSEVYRVLKPNGRFMISDIVLLRELPPAIKNSIEGYIGCLSGALMKGKYIETIREAGFKDAKIVDETSFPAEFMANDPTVKSLITNAKIPSETLEKIANSIVSIKVYGIKPSKLI